MMVTINIDTITNFVTTVGFHSFVMFFNQYFSFINYMVIYRKSQIILNTGNIYGVLLSFKDKVNWA